MRQSRSSPVPIPVLYNLPNGQGSMFTQARSVGGSVNATITLTVLGAGCIPAANYPATDLWLERHVVAGTGNFVSCAGGTVADANTDASGVTRWIAPLRAGGWSTSRALVVINGVPMISNSGLVLRHNSADINGHRKVDLVHIPLFAADFSSGNNEFRSDLQYDGFVNLSDIPRLAAGIGVACH